MEFLDKLWKGSLVEHLQECQKKHLERLSEGILNKPLEKSQEEVPEKT